MDIPAFIDTCKTDELQEELCRLVKDPSSDSLSTLEEFLRYRGRSETKGGITTGTFKTTVPRLPALALLQKGPAGVQVLVRSLTDRHGAGSEAFAALWWAARGKFAPDPLQELSKFQPRDELIRTLMPETIKAARDSVNQLIVEARTSPRLFGDILWFLAFSYRSTSFGREGVEFDDIYEIMMSGAIKLSSALIQQFGDMIEQEFREEEYQLFLKKHPVFLDALAADVIPKQALGIEMVTDFVLRRYDNKYILVEIEKPHDRLFTKNNNFTSKFTHALGQVLDFQQWVDSNGAYAKVHMPGISSPRGLLVIGRRMDLTEQNKSKLHRFSANSSTIDVVTFDDLLENANNLFQTILRKGTSATTQNMSTKSINANKANTADAKSRTAD